jgi:MoxR-like ATPase
LTIQSIDELQDLLKEQLYLADRGLATSIYLMLKLRRPLFLEGAAGVGKTEVAKVVSAILGSELIRLQCYEGLDVHHAVYEWNYTRQMMHIRTLEARNEKPVEEELFGPKFLLRRPLLKAIDHEGEQAPVLLIDEIDRSDEEFEAFLLEILSDFQITIPEIGTIRAKQTPIVVVTSNRTREIHDALKRRCLYHWIDYPSFDQELAIIRLKAPQASEKLAEKITTVVQRLRTEHLYKAPGIAESLDWAEALIALDTQILDAKITHETLGVLLKYEDDLQQIRTSRIIEDVLKE